MSENGSSAPRDESTEQAQVPVWQPDYHGGTRRPSSAPPPTPSTPPAGEPPPVEPPPVDELADASTDRPRIATEPAGSVAHPSHPSHPSRWSGRSPKLLVAGIVLLLAVAGAVAIVGTKSSTAAARDHQSAPATALSDLPRVPGVNPGAAPGAPAAGAGVPVPGPAAPRVPMPAPAARPPVVVGRIPGGTATARPGNRRPGRVVDPTSVGDSPRRRGVTKGVTPTVDSDDSDDDDARTSRPDGGGGGDHRAGRSHRHGESSNRGNSGLLGPLLRTLGGPPRLVEGVGSLSRTAPPLGDYP